MSGEPATTAGLARVLPNAEFRVKGLRERWAASVTTINAQGGFGEEVWNVPMQDTLLAWLIDGGQVISEMPGHRGKRGRRQRTVNLQLAGGEQRYHASGTVRFAHFFLTDELVHHVAEGLGEARFSTALLRSDLILFDDPELWRRLDHFRRRSFDRLDPPNRVEMQASALLVCERLIARHHLLTLPAPSSPERGDWRLRRAVEYAEAHLAEDIGLSELATAVGLSASHFAALFRAGTGEPPHRWLTRLRVERAGELLAGTRLSVTEIAHAVGFASSQHLATVFRKHMGATPTEYRRELLS